MGKWLHNWVGMLCARLFWRRRSRLFVFSVYDYDAQQRCLLLLCVYDYDARAAILLACRYDDASAVACLDTFFARIEAYSRILPAGFRDQLSARYDYDNISTPSAAFPTAGRFPRRFSTKYLDTDTGLYYYGRRYYSPGLGRWPNRDPIEERGGMNLYGFVVNNAVNRIDILGLFGPWHPGPGFGIPMDPYNPPMRHPVVALFSDPLDVEIITWFVEGSGDDLHIASERLHPTDYWLFEFDGGEEPINAACACLGEVEVDLDDDFPTRYLALLQVTFRIQGRAFSTDGKTWQFDGVIRPADERFDFDPLFAEWRPTHADLVTALGRFYQILSGLPSFKIVFDGEVQHPQAGVCSQ